MDGATWIVPAERMKMKTTHVVPLSTQALAVLRDVRAIGGGSRYVFPGRNPDKPMSNNTMLFALYRLGYKGKMTGHGFRTVASTILNEVRYSEPTWSSANWRTVSATMCEVRTTAPSTCPSAGR